MKVSRILVSVRGGTCKLGESCSRRSYSGGFGMGKWQYRCGRGIWLSIDRGCCISDFWFSSVAWPNKNKVGYGQREIFEEQKYSKRLSKRERTLLMLDSGLDRSEGEQC
jgi:hypothetical protein